MNVHERRFSGPAVQGDLATPACRDRTGSWRFCFRAVVTPVPVLVAGCGLSA